MPLFIHSVAAKASILFFAVSSLLGWDLSPQQPIVVSTLSPVVIAATTTLPVKPAIRIVDKAATTTKSSSKPLSYLKIIAPEYSQIAISTPYIPRPSSLPDQVNTIAPALPQPITPTPPSPQPIVGGQGPIVNIFCTFQKGNNLTYITGSGVIIDPKGVIITNSHVAEYVLLADYLKNPLYNCVARTGSPAKPSYTIKAMYLSSAWVQANAQEISQNNTQSTGESDYAFLAITGNTNGTPTSGSFTSLSLAEKDISVSDSIQISGYPAGSMSAENVKSDLRNLSSQSTVQNIYGFQGSNDPDLVVTGPLTIAQRGISGGAITEGNKLYAIIATTITDAAVSIDKDLSAITISYINKDLQAHIGETISSLLKNDPIASAISFEQTIGATLAQTLVRSNPNWP